MDFRREMRVGAHVPAIKVDLGLIPLKQQVNVIWLSKVIANHQQLGERTGITPLYIKCILEHQTEILKRWKEATTTMNKEMKEERNDHNAIRLILLEWAKRSLWNGNKNIDPTIIEKKAKELKLLFHTAKYNISSDFWKEFKAFKMQNANHKRKNVIHSLDTIDVLSSFKSKIPSETYEKFSRLLENHTSSQRTKKARTLECSVDEFIRENNKHINFRISSAIEVDDGEKDEQTLLDQLIYKWCIRYITKNVGPPLEFTNVSVQAHRLKHQLNLRTYTFSPNIWIHACAFKWNRKRPTNPHLSLDFAQILKEHSFEVPQKTIRKFINILENSTELNAPRSENNRTYEYSKPRKVTSINASCTQQSQSVVMTTGQDRETVASNSTSSSNCSAKGRKSPQANLYLRSEDILNETHEDIPQKLVSSEHPTENYKTPRVFNAAIDTDEESLQSVLPNYSEKFVYTNDDDVLVTISDNCTESKQQEPELKDNLLGNTTTKVDNHEHKAEMAETESTKPETKEETVAVPKEEEEFMECEEEFISCRSTNNDKGENESEANTIPVTTTNALENVFAADLDENGCIEVLEIIDDEDDVANTEDMSQKNNIEIYQETVIGNFPNINNTTMAVSNIDQEENLIHNPIPGQQNVEVHLVAKKEDFADKICTKPDPSSPSSIRKEKKPKRTKKRYKFGTPKRKYKEKKDTNAKLNIENIKIKDIGISNDSVSLKISHNANSARKNKLKSGIGQQNLEDHLAAQKPDANDKNCIKPAPSFSTRIEKKLYKFGNPKRKYQDTNVTKNIENIKIKDIGISNDSASLEISHNVSSLRKSKLNSMINKNNLQNIKGNPVENNTGGDAQNKKNRICTKKKPNDITNKHRPKKDKTDLKKTEVYLQIVDGAQNTSLSFLVSPFCSGDKPKSKGKIKSNKRTTKIDNQNIEILQNAEIGVTDDEDCQITGVSFIQEAEHSIYPKVTSEGGCKPKEKNDESMKSNLEFNSAAIEKGVAIDDGVTTNSLVHKDRNSNYPKKTCTNKTAGYKDVQMNSQHSNVVQSEIVNDKTKNVNPLKKVQNSFCAKEKPENIQSNLYLDQFMATDDEDCQITGVSFIQGGEHSIYPKEASEGGAEQKEKHKNYESMKSNFELNSAAIENGVVDDRIMTNSLVHKMRNSNHSKKNSTNIPGEHEDLEMYIHHPNAVQFETTSVDFLKKQQNSICSKKNVENIQSSFCLGQEIVNQTCPDYHLMAVSIASETENVIIKPNKNPSTPKVIDGKRNYIDKENQILSTGNNIKLSKKPKYSDKTDENCNQRKEKLKEDNNDDGANINNDSNDHNPQRNTSDEKDNGEEMNSDNSNVEIHLEIIDDDKIDENSQKANVSLLQKYQNSSDTKKPLKYSQLNNHLEQKLTQKAYAVNESNQTITVSKTIERENVIETPNIKQINPKSINKEDNEANCNIKSFRIAEDKAANISIPFLPKSQNEIPSSKTTAPIANGQNTICTTKSRPDIQNKEKIENNGYPYSEGCQITTASVNSECKNAIKSLKRKSTNNISSEYVAKYEDYPLDPNIEIHLEIIDDIDAVEEDKQNEEISLLGKRKTKIFKEVLSAMEIPENAGTITNTTNSNNKDCQIADISIPKTDLKNRISHKKTNKKEGKGNCQHKNDKGITKAHQKIVNEDNRSNVSLLNKRENLVLSEKSVAKNIEKEKINNNFEVKQEIEKSSTAPLIFLRKSSQKVLSERKYENSKKDKDSQNTDVPLENVDDRKTSLKSPANISCKPMVILPNDVYQYNTNIVVKQEIDDSKTDLTIPLKYSTQKVLGKGKYEDSERDTEVHLEIVDDRNKSQKSAATTPSKPKVYNQKNANQCNTNVVVQQKMDNSKTDLTIPLQKSTPRVLGKVKNENNEMHNDKMDTEVYLEIVDDNADERNKSEKSPDTTIPSKPKLNMQKDVNQCNTNTVEQQGNEDSEIDNDSRTTKVHIGIVDDHAVERNKSQKIPSKPKVFKQKGVDQYNTNIVVQQENEDIEIDNDSQTTEVYLEIVDDYADDRNKSQKSPATTIPSNPKVYKQKYVNQPLNIEINQTDVGCPKAKMKNANHLNNTNENIDNMEHMDNSNIEIHLEIVEDDVVGEKNEIENISLFENPQNSVDTKKIAENGQENLKLDQVMINSNSNSLIWAKNNPQIHSSNEEKVDIDNQTAEVHLEIVDGDAADETLKDASIYLQNNENDFLNITINQEATNKRNVAKLDCETLIYTKRNLPDNHGKCLEQDAEQNIHFNRIRLEQQNKNRENPTYVQSKINAIKTCPTGTDSNDDINTTDNNSNQNDEDEESVTILEIIPDGEVPNEVLNRQDVITFDPMDILNIFQKESVNKFNNQHPQMHEKSSGAQTNVTAKKPFLKNTSEAVIYLSKLKDFFVRQKNPIGIKLVLNLELSFFCGDLIDDDD